MKVGYMMVVNEGNSLVQMKISADGKVIWKNDDSSALHKKECRSINLKEYGLKKNDEIKVVFNYSGKTIEKKLDYAPDSDVVNVYTVGISSVELRQEGTYNEPENVRYIRFEHRSMSAVRLVVYQQVPGQTDKKVCFKSGRLWKDKAATCDLVDELKLPDGTEVCIEADVMAGKSRYADEKFYVDSKSKQTAVYSSSGGVLRPSLKLESYK